MKFIIRNLETGKISFDVAIMPDGTFLERKNGAYLIWTVAPTGKYEISYEN